MAFVSCSTLSARATQKKEHIARKSADFVQSNQTKENNHQVRQVIGASAERKGFNAQTMHPPTT